MVKKMKCQAWFSGKTKENNLNVIMENLSWKYTPKKIFREDPLSEGKQNNFDSYLPWKHLHSP